MHREHDLFCFNTFLIETRNRKKMKFVSLKSLFWLRQFEIPEQISLIFSHQSLLMFHVFCDCLELHAISDATCFSQRELNIHLHTKQRNACLELSSDLQF